MKLKVKLAHGASVAYTSTGHKFMADPDGCVEVEQCTTDHYDLLAAGGSVVADEPTQADSDGPAEG